MGIRCGNKGLKNTISEVPGSHRITEWNNISGQSGPVFDPPAKK